MTRVLAVVLVIVAAQLAACRDATSPVAVTEPTAISGSRDDSQLVRMVEEYFDASLSLDPFYAPFFGERHLYGQLGNNLSDDFLKARQALVADYLARSEAFVTSDLSSSRQITLAVFRHSLSTEQQLSAFPAWLLPINQFDSRVLGFWEMASGEGLFPFLTAKDYQAFINRIQQYPVWSDTAVLRLQQGVEQGVVLPKVLVERVIAQLDSQLSGPLDQSLFVGPLKDLVKRVGETEASVIDSAYRAALTNELMPAMVRMRDYLKNHYLAKARASSGYGAMPNGQDWYQALANLHTTTLMPVGQIHQLGLSEVARIHQEMDQVRQQVGFTGDLKTFFNHLATDDRFFFTTPEQLIAAYGEVKTRIEARLGDYFDLRPKADYEVWPVEAYRQQSAAGASYSAPALDGSRPGVFYINTFNLRAQPTWGVTTLSLHEAAPGHHFQVALQQEMNSLPRFQRYYDATAYVEGWALYAEYLGIEMGVFSDPYQYFGKLSDELLRAMRLVVDTGLHAKGWSREQAIAYMLDNSAMAESDVFAEVERYMAIPGQALSYKVGQLKIIELRQQLQQKQGDGFDIKAFHRAVLEDGALPLGVLEQKLLAKP
ncbi:MAG: DUF885 domain-containing protein [Gammaproteobacteria bacterium]|nr:DUF885 domain-containing protein [Gammaproteobacteria bacterium]